jgi:hypothetical protein
MGEETTPLNWPSTTGVLKHFGFGYGSVPHKDAMRRGRLVTAACHMIAAGDSDPPWEARHPECAPYLDAYRRFFREHRFILIEAEREYRSAPLRFISHPDQIGMLDEVGVVDLELKSGTYPRWVQLQTAGQVIAMGTPTMKRFCLQLKNDGNYVLTPHEDWRDLDRFRALVDAYWTVREFGLEPGAIPS